MWALWAWKGWIDYQPGPKVISNLQNCLGVLWIDSQTRGGCKGILWGCLKPTLEKYNLIQGFRYKMLRHTHWGTNSAKYALDCRRKLSKKFPGQASRTQRCSGISFCEVYPSPRQWNARSAPADLFRHRLLVKMVLQKIKGQELTILQH